MTSPHNFDPSILRAYDIRGIYEETLTNADAYNVGRSFAKYMQNKGWKTASVGRDGRVSSPALEESLVRGLIDSGVNVTRIGVCPTPMLYFAQHHLDTDTGLMISGSHNPPHHNGIKICLRTGPFYGEDIQQLGKIAAVGDYISGQAGEDKFVDVMPDYLNMLLSDLNNNYDDASKGFKIAWDTGNGSAGEVVKKLTEKLPGEHHLLFNEIDGTFPNHHPDPCVPENLDDLIAFVKANDLDFGFAFDGDGDRLGLVDNKGRILCGDTMLTLLAEEVLTNQPGAKILADVKCSQVMFDRINAMGGEPVMCRTGHSLIKAKMQETGSPLAGEMSGHIFFADRLNGVDDAMYAAIRVIGGLTRKSESLTQWYDNYPQLITTPEIQYDCPDDKKFAFIANIKQHLLDQGANFNDIDGVRVTTENGWWLVRASNTQAVLTARMEANDEAGMANIKAEVDRAMSFLG